MNHYEYGKYCAMNYRHLTFDILRRLRNDPDFWQGWHDERPKLLERAAKEFRDNLYAIEDPTRENGWLTRPRRDLILKPRREGEE